MLDAVMKRILLHLLAGAVRHEDPSVREELALSFWDIKYLYLYGIPKIPSPDVPAPPFVNPQTDLASSMQERFELHEELLFGLIDIAAGDPSPQPSVQAVLQDREARLNAARNLAERLDSGLEQLREEIERLENE